MRSRPSEVRATECPAVEARSYTMAADALVTRKIGNEHRAKRVGSLAAYTRTSLLVLALIILVPMLAPMFVLINRDGLVNDNGGRLHDNCWCGVHDNGPGGAHDNRLAIDGAAGGDGGTKNAERYSSD